MLTSVRQITLSTAKIVVIWRNSSTAGRRPFDGLERSRRRAMKNIIRVAITAVVLSLELVAPSAAGPLEDGLAAYGRGDYATAIQLLRPFADQGNADAQSSLGFMYQNGRGVPHDDAIAVAWYQKAADQGNANAQNNLGFMYQNGRGVPHHDAIAVTWYQKAADQGNAQAQHNLGVMYQNGRGVSQDDAAALSWFRKAADQGYAPAQDNLELMRLHGRDLSSTG